MLDICYHGVMDTFFQPDARFNGAKGLVFVGDKIIVYRRSDDAPTNPHELDLPGGGAEPGETPFATFQRETQEEFGLSIAPEDIAYAKRYPRTNQPGWFTWFAVAKLPASAEHDIVFGNEGTEYSLITLEDYLSRDDAWELFQARAREYMETTA